MEGVSTDQMMRALMVGALLVFLVGGLALESRAGRSRAMRQMAAWAVIFAAVAGGALWWQERQAAPRLSGEGTRIELRLGRDGHFHLPAQVNGTTIPFLIDTGASSLVLSRRDAAAAGLDPRDLNYRNRAMTANGPVHSAPVRLDEVRIGAVSDRDVPAEVIEGDLGMSLMGMSFLSGFARVSIEGDRMILER